jgi:hypothetical protein
MDLVDDDEFAWLPAQVGIRVIEATPIRRTFHVEVKRFGGSIPGQSSRSGGFADLARTQQHNRRAGVQLSAEILFGEAGIIAANLISDVRFAAL